MGGISTLEPPGFSYGEAQIALVAERNNELVLVGADISTGECFYGLYDGSEREQMVFDELYQLMASEILLVDKLSFQKSFNSFVALRLNDCTITKLEEPNEDVVNILSEHFSEDELPPSDFATEAVAVLMTYVHQTLMTDAKHISKLTRLEISDRLILDPTALKNLEITRSLRDGGKKDTLFDVMDLTRTAMGKYQI